MEKSKLELKVGLFVLFGMVILIVFIFKIGNFRNYGAGYQLKFVFGNVSGVKSGSPVRFCGVNVGQVNEVNILKNRESGNTKIELVAWVKESLSIPAGSRAYINTLGLLGEKYIEIVPPSEYSTFLKSGDVLTGVDPVTMQEWADEAEHILKDLGKIIASIKEGEGTIGKLLYDDKLYLELEELVGQLRGAKAGTVGRLLYDDNLYLELEALISDVRKHPWKLFWKTKEKKVK
ncbi:MAG: MlaD family protein [Candidatus Omnitrophota bacterium]